jgi:hypothetical protein
MKVWNLRKVLAHVLVLQIVFLGGLTLYIAQTERFLY